MKRAPREVLISAACLAAILAVGVAARVVGWHRVFTAQGVRFIVDSDPLYHVLLAERLVRDGLKSAWFDPALNWPHGASVLWPPLFDMIIAGAAAVWKHGEIAFGDLERAAAVVPVVLGVATLVVVAAFAKTLLGRGRGLGAAFVVALLQAHVSYSAVGRADQHVLETLLSCWILLAFVASWRARTRRGLWVAAGLMGLGIALSFWNWQGSPFNLILPVAFAGACHVFFAARPEVVRRVELALFVGLASGALILGVTVAVWGAPGALSAGGLVAISGLHVALTACGAAFAGLLLAFGRRRRSAAGATRRVGEVVAAFLLPPVVALSFFPAMREGIRTGLAVLGAANPWYEHILELKPRLFSCDLSIWGDLTLFARYLGLGVPAAILAVPSLVRRWRASEEDRPAIFFLACWGVAYFALAVARRRLAPYFIAPMAILAWEGVCFTAESLASRLWPGRRAFRAFLAGVGAVAVVGPCLREIPKGFPTEPESRLEALRWLKRRESVPDREGVLSNWSLGHLVLYYARKPVIATPFGSDGGANVMEDAARFAFSTDPAHADAVLLARHVGYLALLDPAAEGITNQGFAPPGTPVAVREVCSYATGGRLVLSSAYYDLTAPRLYLFDGLAAPGRFAAPLSRFRLVYESPTLDVQAQTFVQPLKIFEVVPGARVVVTGARGRVISAAAEVRTNQGRPFAWTLSAQPDGAGRAEMRLPYATGMNGAVNATGWSLSDGSRTVQLAISEDDVARGNTVEVDLTRVDGAGDGVRARPAAARAWH